MGSHYWCASGQEIRLQALLRRLLRSEAGFAKKDPSRLCRDHFKSSRARLSHALASATYWLALIDHAPLSQDFLKNKVAILSDRLLPFLRRPDEDVQRLPSIEHAAYLTKTVKVPVVGL